MFTPIDFRLFDRTDQHEQVLFYCVLTLLHSCDFKDYLSYLLDVQTAQEEGEAPPRPEGLKSSTFAFPSGSSGSFHLNR